MVRRGRADYLIVPRNEALRLRANAEAGDVREGDPRIGSRGGVGVGRE